MNAQRLVWAWFRESGRSFVLAAAGLVATYVMGSTVAEHYPIAQWYVWDWSRLVLWDALLSLGCLSGGHWVVTKCLRLTELRGAERLALSMTAGVILFVEAMYLGGYLGWYGPAWGILLPLGLLLGGLPCGIPVVSDWWARWRREGSGLRGGALGMTLIGTIGLLILYLGILSPNAVNYDANWNHLVIAQDYAREGRIIPFPGDWVKNVPHLGSVINTWAFLVPGFGTPVLHYMLALHTEYTLFLWTLVSVAAMAQWTTNDSSLRGAWPVMLLFPSLFVYDGNMGANADHYLAFFSVPLVMVAIRAMQRLEPRVCIFLGAIAACAAMTKFHAMYLLVPLGLALSWRWGNACYRRWRAPADRETSLWMGPAAALISALVCSSPHYIGSAVFFGNPFYPLLQEVIPSHPTVRDAGLQMNNLFIAYPWHPPADMWERIVTTVKLVFTYSFSPQYAFSSRVPTFGSLFTMSLFFLPWLKQARRVRFVVFVTLGALATWAFTYRVDRNLQTFLPVMAVATIGVLVLAWRTGSLARIGVVTLTGMHLVWGGDLYFSALAGASDSVGLITSGLSGRARQRYDHYNVDFLAMGDWLPKDAVVIIHNIHQMLGINRTVYLDWVGFQGIVDYRTMKNPRDVYERYRQLGVTHVLYLSDQERPPAYRQEQVLFDVFAAQNLEQTKRFGRYRVFALPETPPAETKTYQVAVLGANGYASGLYSIDKLSVCEEMPASLQLFPSPDEPATTPEAQKSIVAKADAVVLAGASRSDYSLVSERFKRVGAKTRYDVWAKK
jgi:hypothetical protein